MKTITCILTIFLTLALFSVAKEAPAASLSLSMPDGNPGRRVIAKPGFDNAGESVAFNLKLDFSDGKVLSPTPKGFQRSLDFFPALCLGGQEVNFMEKSEADTFRFAGLVSHLGNFSSDMARLTFDIPESAAPNDVHILTLSGEIYTDNGNLITLSPVSVTFTVIPFTDTDNDNMDDSWEEYYFRSLLRTGAEDYDYDGKTNQDEYLKGNDPTDNIKKGDINRDSETDINDVIVALQVCVGIPLPVCKESDIDGDGKIKIEEVIYILQDVAEFRQ